MPNRGAPAGVSRSNEGKVPQLCARSSIAPRRQAQLEPMRGNPPGKRAAIGHQGLLCQPQETGLPMVKEEGCRSAELRELGWSAEEVRVYEELWEYRQRWGAINLEREERQLLRKAEAALPKRPKSGRGAARKTLAEKAHHRWLSFHLAAMQASASALGLDPQEEAAWPIILEEELRALEYYEPVLGLPDTLKAKLFLPERERWATEAASLGRVIHYDYAAPLEALKLQGPTSWKPLRGDVQPAAADYPVLEGETARSFRAKVRREISAFTRATYPSLQDSDKPAPAETAQED